MAADGRGAEIDTSYSKEPVLRGAEMLNGRWKRDSDACFFLMSLRCSGLMEDAGAEKHAFLESLR